MAKIELPASAVKMVEKAVREVPEPKQQGAKRYAVKCWKVANGLRACNMDPNEDGLSDKDKRQILETLKIKSELIEAKPRRYGFCGRRRERDRPGVIAACCSSGARSTASSSPGKRLHIPLGTAHRSSRRVLAGLDRLIKVGRALEKPEEVARRVAGKRPSDVHERLEEVFAVLLGVLVRGRTWSVLFRRKAKSHSPVNGCIAVARTMNSPTT